MEYTTEVTNNSTGEIIDVSLGNWMTITEFGQSRGVGPRQVRDILFHIGLLQDEIEDMTAKDAPYTQRDLFKRRRLTHKAVRKGLGKRLYSVTGRPFDVLSPKGQVWIDQRWEDAVHAIKSDISSSPEVVAAKAAFDGYQELSCNKVSAKAHVWWLLDRFPGLLRVEISRITGVSKRMVTYHAQRWPDHVGKKEMVSIV